MMPRAQALALAALHLAIVVAMVFVLSLAGCTEVARVDGGGAVHVSRWVTLWLTGALFWIGACAIAGRK